LTETRSDTDQNEVGGEELKELERRAGDAKFYLSLGSGSFLVVWLLLMLSRLLYPFPPNLDTALLIASLCYLIPGLILFSWGLVKVFRGKDLTLRQVIHAYIQPRDVRKTVKFLAFVTFFTVLLLLPIVLGQSAQDLMQNLVTLCLAVVGPPGLYLGVFLISIFGNFTVIFPVPYILVLLVIASRPDFTFLDGLIMGLVAGMGAAIGETSAWLLGRSQTEALEDSATGQRLLKVKDQIERGYGGLLIFIYAATPLPDDVLLIALGATRYPLWKAVTACFFGKVILCLAVALGAKMPIIGPLLQDMFGGTADPFRETLYLVIGLALILFIFFIPWGEIGGRLLRRKQEN